MNNKRDALWFEMVAESNLVLGIENVDANVELGRDIPFVREPKYLMAKLGSPLLMPKSEPEAAEFTGATAAVKTSLVPAPAWF
jgi:hypothetical protein